MNGHYDMENENSHTKPIVNNDLFLEIKKFIIKERWKYAFEIDMNTSIQSDLKIYGDDASEFISKFCKKFSLNCETFVFSDYFAPEPSWFDLFRKTKAYKNLTVRDLMKAVEEGCL